MASHIEEARQSVMSLVNNIGWDTIANSLDLVPEALDALIAAVREEEREAAVGRFLAMEPWTEESGERIVEAIRNAD